MTITCTTSLGLKPIKRLKTYISKLIITLKPMRHTSLLHIAKILDTNFFQPEATCTVLHLGTMFEFSFARIVTTNSFVMSFAIVKNTSAPEYGLRFQKPKRRESCLPLLWIDAKMWTLMSLGYRCLINEKLVFYLIE